MRQALRYVGLYGLAAIISVTGMLLAHACTPAMAEPVVSDLSIVAVGDSVRVGVWVQQPASADSVVAFITGNGGSRRVPHKTGIGWQPLFAGTLAAPDSGLSAWYYAAVTAYRDGVPSATRRDSVRYTSPRPALAAPVIDSMSATQAAIPELPRVFLDSRYIPGPMSGETLVYGPVDKGVSIQVYRERHPEFTWP